MKTSYYLKASFPLLAFSLFATGLSALEPGEIFKLEGVALYSFSDSSFMVESGPYVYKISKRALEPIVAEEIGRATEQRQRVSVAIPRSAVEFVWPNALESTAVDRAVKKYNKTVAAAKSGAKKHGGEFTIKGTSELSFSDAFFLVLVSDKVYRVKKSALSAEQIDVLNKVGIGGFVSATFPSGAVEFVWSFKQPIVRAIASGPPAEEAKIEGSSLSLRGTVLHSFDAPVAIVQSKDFLFQIRKELVPKAASAALENPGAKVKMTVPTDAVEFFWSVGPKDLGFRRGPASLK